MPDVLDEYPIHQAPISMRWFATSDRNVYDRCIMHGFDAGGRVQFASGLGVYPHVGVIDAYLTVRVGDRIVAAQVSGALGANRMLQEVEGYRIDVLEPLQSVRLVLDAADLGIEADLTFTGAFPATDEPHHHRRVGELTLLDASRFVQTGGWSGTLRVAGDTITADDWTGARDRSWGIRPVGTVSPMGRWAAGAATGGNWWCWIPLRFESFQIVIVLEEDADGHRSINDALRVWPDGRIEQLGWPEYDITYRPGTRYPERAVFRLRERSGRELVLDIEPLGPMPLAVGCGYSFNPDDDWGHGRWMGESWRNGVDVRLDEPAVAARVAHSMIDHAARATLDGEVGYGIFEHSVSGRHDPSGFAGHGSVAG